MMAAGPLSFIAAEAAGPSFRNSCWAVGILLGKKAQLPSITFFYLFLKTAPSILISNVMPCRISYHIYRI